MLAAAGCGGGGGGGGPGPGPAPMDSLPNPVELTFRPHDLGTPAAPDGVDYRTPEFRAHYGLDSISADAAYRRGYFGQGATIAVADDGLDTTHPDLAGRIVTPRHVTNGNDRVYERDGGGGHGTFVAMLAAGARGNTGGDFEIDIAGSDPIPTSNVHGVAPRASIVPIALAGGGQPHEAVRHAVANGADVVNFSIGAPVSYFGRYAGREGVWLTRPLPRFRPLVDDGLLGNFSAVATAVGNSDIVMVWAAGNDRWNSVNGRISMCGKNTPEEDGCELGELHPTGRELMRDFTWLPDPTNDPDREVPLSDIWGTDCGSEDCADYNSGGGWTLAPSWQPGLLGKWLVVGALDRDGEIASFSNGCGAARNWCLMAPGVDLAVGPGGEGISGTSFAAPLVSGALAVLKSRLPGMPMEVVQALLLVSADPLGSRVGNPREPDAVYGWGRLNLENAVTAQGAVHLPYSVPDSAGPNGIPLRGARIGLSPALATMSEGLRGVEVAVGGVGDAYYNMNLIDAVAIEGTGIAPAPLGRAARDMLAPAGGHRSETEVSAHNLFAETDRHGAALRKFGAELSSDSLGTWRVSHNLCANCGNSAWREWSRAGTFGFPAAPFFADPRGALAVQMQGGGLRPFAAASAGQGSARAPWRQFGLRWQRAGRAYAAVAEVSRVDESRSVWGTDFGALGDTRTRTVQGRFLTSAALDGNWRGFLGYERGSAEVSTTGGMLSGIFGLRAEGWSAGAERKETFRDGDLVRFSVRRSTSVRGGRAEIDHTVATGSSFVDAFYRNRPQSLQRRRTEVDLRARPATRYALGYAWPLGNDTRLATALEYEAESGDRAVSAQLQMRF